MTKPKKGESYGAAEDELAGDLRSGRRRGPLALIGLGVAAAMGLFLSLTDPMTRDATLWVGGAVLACVVGTGLTLLILAVTLRASCAFCRVAEPSFVRATVLSLAALAVSLTLTYGVSVLADHFEAAFLPEPLLGKAPPATPKATSPFGIPLTWFPLVWALNIFVTGSVYGPFLVKPRETASKGGIGELALQTPAGAIRGMQIAFCQGLMHFALLIVVAMTIGLFLFGAPRIPLFPG